MTPEQRIKKIKRIIRDAQEDGLHEPVLEAILSELSCLEEEIK